MEYHEKAAEIEPRQLKILQSVFQISTHVPWVNILYTVYTNTLFSRALHTESKMLS